MLLICAARASGVENTRKNIILLFESFSKTQAAIQDAKPELDASAKKLSTLSHEMMYLSQKYREGEITLENYDTEKERINKDLAILKNVGATMTLTAYKIIQSVDFNKLEVS